MGVWPNSVIAPQLDSALVGLLTNERARPFVREPSVSSRLISADISV